ncbi:MAG: hypothetical protein WBM63_05340, partial [Sedimenticolaceae bacterium]
FWEEVEIFRYAEPRLFELRFDLLPIHHESITVPFFFAYFFSAILRFSSPPSLVVSINPQGHNDRRPGDTIEFSKDGQAMFGVGNMVK